MIQPLNVKLFAFWDRGDQLGLVGLRVAHLLDAMEQAEGAELVAFDDSTFFLGGFVTKGFAQPRQVQTCASN
jgi:hypothetical protein